MPLTCFRNETGLDQGEVVVKFKSGNRAHGDGTGPIALGAEGAVWSWMWWHDIAVYYQGQEHVLHHNYFAKGSEHWVVNHDGHGFSLTLRVPYIAIAEVVQCGEGVGVSSKN